MDDQRLRTKASYLLAAIMIGAGYFHFKSPEPFISIVPFALPYKRELVLISGFFEILGGIGLLLPFSRRAASIGLIALYCAVFPANVNMAVNNLPINGQHFSPLVLWLRLPLQALLIWWSWWCGQASSSRTGSGR